jgi:hypothetical protein
MTQNQEKTIFFAYQGKPEGQHSNCVESIAYAIKNYNEHQKGYIAKSWEDYKTSTPISIEILNVINECEVFVADLTYFNFNVLFELGYAIAKNKKILIILNKDVQGSAETYKDSILKNIRYTPYGSSKEIQAALQNKEFEEGILEKFANVKNLERGAINLLYLKNDLNNQASIDLNDEIESLKAARGFSLLIDDPLENIYRSVAWYLQNLYKSKRVIIHFRGIDTRKAPVENAKNSFFAGLAVGFGNEVLLVAPAKYNPPLDYHEILVSYTSSTDLISVAKTWIEKALSEDQLKAKTLITDQKKESAALQEEQDLGLIKLGIGYEIAENEKDELLKYFLETATYYSALSQSKIIVVGRKGSGKSAIYIKALDALSRQPLNYVINLRPESSELTEDIQLSNVFKNPSTKKTFFSAVWRLTIFSKLAYAIYEQIATRPDYVNTSPEEEKLANFVRDHETFMRMNVFGVISEARKTVTDSGKDLNSPRILEDLYQTYLGELRSVLKEYFKSVKTKYSKITIIADNLDQAWDPKTNLDVQSEMIASLLEVDHQISNELIDRDNKQVTLKIIIFLRKDIFNYILKEVNEPDKLIVMAQEIDWEKTPQLLKRLIENRFKFILGLENEEQLEKVWQEFFEFKDKKHPFDIVLEITVKRPRDVIYFLSQLFISAINRGANKVNDLDLNYAIENYSNFLNNNLIAETRAEFPEIGDILAKLQEYFGQRMEYQTYSNILSGFHYDQAKKSALTKTLFEKGYMLGFDMATNKPFSDVETLERKLKEKRFLFFPNKVYVIAHANYYLIKNLTGKIF